MRRTMAVLLASGLLLAAGCGDDDDEESSGQGSGASTQAETSGGGDTGSSGASGGGSGSGTKVSLTDFKIDPANPTAKPGTVTYSVTNDGQVPHALEIEGNGIEEETEVLNGGESAELTVDLEAGEYKWYCPVGTHADQGMAGVLTVK